MENSLGLAERPEGPNAIASRLEAIASRLEAMATRSKDATRGSWPYY